MSSTPAIESTLGHASLLDLIIEVLARERQGAKLYRALQSEAAEDVQHTMIEYGEDIENHVVVLQQVISDLGGNVPLDTADASGLATGGARQWLELYEAIYMFETQDQIAWETLSLLAQKPLDDKDASILSSATAQIESAEALGAHNGSRHSERIRWARTMLRNTMLNEYGVEAPAPGVLDRVAVLFQ